MRKLLLLALLSLPAFGQGTAIAILGSLLRCPGTATQVLVSTSTGLQCQTLATFAAALYAALPPPASTPQYQTETISLSALAPTATTVSYTTVKTPISPVFWWYQVTPTPVTILLFVNSGVFNYTGEPLVFTLPTGWTPTDTITISYRWQ
jgi:hypothetical protein